MDGEGDVHIRLRTALISYTLSFSWNSCFFQRLTLDDVNSSGVGDKDIWLILVSFHIFLRLCLSWHRDEVLARQETSKNLSSSLEVNCRQLSETYGTVRDNVFS